MNEKDNFALVPRLPGTLQNTEPGAGRILSGMVADTLALAKKAPPSKSRPLRIVSVDDEYWRLYLVEMTISSYFKGVTVQSFLDAEEAWQELSRTDPDLLITDDIMGKLNGDEIVQRLADRKAAYSIIVISGWAGPETEQWVSECVKRGVDVTLLRAPYYWESLAKALESGLRISRDTTGPDGVAPQPSRTRPLRVVHVGFQTDWLLEYLGSAIRLKYENAIIKTFMDGDLAWQELMHEDPDLLITDLCRLRGLNGFDMVSRLAEKKGKYPVLVYSGLMDKPGEDHVLRLAGSNLNVTCLYCPFTLEEFYRALSNLLGPDENLPQRDLRGAL